MKDTIGEVISRAAELDLYEVVGEGEEKGVRGRFGYIMKNCEVWTWVLLVFVSKTLANQ